MVVTPFTTEVAGVTVKPEPTLDWLNVAPVYGPVELTDTTSVPSTPAKDCVPVTAIVAALVVS